MYRSYEYKSCLIKVVIPFLDVKIAKINFASVSKLSHNNFLHSSQLVVVSSTRQHRRGFMSRQTYFKGKHAVEFGLASVKKFLDVTITTVECLFCVHFGREKQDGPGVKRQQTQNVQLFQFPFRPKNYKIHLKKQHPND